MYENCKLNITLSLKVEDKIKFIFGEQYYFMLNKSFLQQNVSIISN